MTFKRCDGCDQVVSCHSFQRCAKAPPPAEKPPATRERLDELVRRLRASDNARAECTAHEGPYSILGEAADAIVMLRTESEKQQNAAPQDAMAGARVDSVVPPIPAVAAPGTASAARLPEGTWSENDPRRAFVDGAKWMLWQTKGVTMFSSEREGVEAEAAKRYAPSSARLPTIEEITRAVARGWCSPNNAHKTVDPELAFAISAQIMALLNAGTRSATRLPEEKS